MAELSLGECKWRMLRRVLRAKRFRFEDCRNGTRRDDRDFEWLLENGFFTAVGAGWHEMTEKGRASADLGVYQYEPRTPGRGTPTAKKRRKP